MLSKDEFLAGSLKLYPQLRVEVLPNGEKVIHGIRLKTKEEMQSGRRVCDET